MSPQSRARWTAAAVATGVFVLLGYAGWQMLRDPLKDLPVRPRQDRAADKAADVFRPQLPPPAAGGFVGSAACAECHAEVHHEYHHSHPMGQSLARIGEEHVVEDYVNNTTFEPPPSTKIRLSWRYEVERSAEGVYHHEVALDPQGEVVYDNRVPIHYAVGSGQRGRSYVIDRDGLLYMSSITWYSEKQRWNLSPGYLVQNLRFERRVFDGCLVCHTGRMTTQPDRPDFHAPPTFLEETIGCEQCHGPGQAHVEYRRRQPTDGRPDPIVNPLTLEPDLRDSVCYQCHLSGETRITRYGRTHLDFRPGDDLSDIWTVFVRGTGITQNQTTSAVSQPEQMEASACYQKSDRQLSCLSCHDPHSIPQPEERIEFYRSRCLECHASNGAPCSESEERRKAVTAEDSCIHCHMPRIDANDVPHTSQTDHRVLRVYPTGEPSTPSREQQPLRIFGRAAERMTPQELDRALGVLIVRNADRSSDPLLALEGIPKLEPWFAAAPEDVQVAEALGAAYALNHENEAAQTTWERSLALNPNSEELLHRLVVLLQDGDKPAEALKYAERLVALNPWQHEYLGRYAHMLGQQKRYDEAIEAAERALAINPLAAEIHGWLAEVHALRGDQEQSQRHQELFKKLTARR